MKQQQSTNASLQQELDAQKARSVRERQSKSLSGGIEEAQRAITHPAGTKAINVVLGMARQGSSALVALQEVKEMVDAAANKGVDDPDQWEGKLKNWAAVLGEATNHMTCLLRMLGLEAAFWLIVNKLKSDPSKAMEVAETYRNSMGYNIKMMHPASWSTSGSMDAKFTKFVDHDFATIHPATEKLALESYSVSNAQAKKAEAETPGIKERPPRTPREDRSDQFKSPRVGSSSFRPSYSNKGSSHK